MLLQQVNCVLSGMQFLPRSLLLKNFVQIYTFSLGSCGSLKKEVTIGNFAIASKGSKMVVTDFDEVGSFTISKTIMPDAELTKTVTKIFFKETQ